MRVLGPVVDFHKAVEEANDNDLRIFWDVRVIRGASELFVNSSGSSSMPGILSPKLRPTAAALIQQEVAEKIAAPLVGHMQTVIETGALEGALLRRGNVVEVVAPRLGNGKDTVVDARKYE